MDMTSSALSQGWFDIFPMQAVVKNRQWVTKIDHLNQAITENVINQGSPFTNPKKASIEYLFDSTDHLDLLNNATIHGAFRYLTGATI